MKNKINGKEISKYNEILKKIKIDPVLIIAWLLALISMFFVIPGKKYFSYIDFRTLGILFGLMVISQGLKKNYVFDIVAKILLRKVNTVFGISLVLILLNYFVAMFITNDVALIIFIPFSIMLLNKCGRKDLYIYLACLQTIAANMGSMLTPIGNPQNLYLFTASGVSVFNFIKITMIYSLFALVLLVICLLFIRDKNKALEISDRNDKEPVDSYDNKNKKINFIQIAIYTVLFILALFVVARVIDYKIFVVFTLITIIFMDRKILLKVDYGLLLTFTGFFIFVGNISRIDKISMFLGKIIRGREFFTTIILSQFISNVPAAILLSGFTDKYKELIIGVNIGGFGTIIASMASLISYKIYADTKDSKKGKYLITFSCINAIFLFFMISIYLIVGTLFR
ncbi:Na+/H+ antiporter NhaD [Lachnospiraceae bacterium RM5]|nr:Na+/H+ antiporter NhaD [Lachnospiraceae bacterium RM5]